MLFRPRTVTQFRKPLKCNSCMQHGFKYEVEQRQQRISQRVGGLSNKKALVKIIGDSSEIW